MVCILPIDHRTPNHCDAVDAIVRPSVRARSLHVYRLYAPSSVEERILDVQRAKTAVAEFIRDGLFRLGPTFVKLGQVISTRTDIVHTHTQ